MLIVAVKPIRQAGLELGWSILFQRCSLLADSGHCAEQGISVFIAARGGQLPIQSGYPSVIL